MHDPGSDTNRDAMRARLPGHLGKSRWMDPDHPWHVAYWLHQGLLNYAHRTSDVSEADVIFVAHYFLTVNPVRRPLFFGDPLLGWDQKLREGPLALFDGAPAVMRRWERRSSDFVVAPILIACLRAPAWLRRGARWIITEPFFRNRCGYRHGYDLVVPQVVSSAVWAPPAHERARTPSALTGAPTGARKGHFLLYVGRLGKAYLDPPMSELRLRMWLGLRAHPNVTFLATDVNETLLPYLESPARPCPRCLWRCKRCVPLRTPAEAAQGSLRRVASKRRYRAMMGDATFCLVLRGDNENTRKFTEAILAGCIPVLIADMPEWPFSRRLDYAAFSYEFDWAASSRDPRHVVETLLRLPAPEVASKRRQLLRVRRHFFYHANVSLPAGGAVRQIIADMCDQPSARARARARRGPTAELSALYELRLQQRGANASAPGASTWPSWKVSAPRRQYLLDS